MMIMVTGSSGIIGTRLCEVLLERGHKIVGVDQNPNRWNETVNKNTIIADLLDKKAVDNLPKNIDMVVHLAANSRVHEMLTNTELSIENILMTFNILEFVRKNNINKIIFGSSREIYGNVEDEIKFTEDGPRIDKCENPYSASKVSGEALLSAFTNSYGIEFVSIRFSNVYGMYDMYDRLMPTFIRKTRNGEDLVIFGKDKILDFIYIDDAIDGVVKIIENFEKVKNNVFNLTSGKSISLLNLAELIKKAMKANSNIIVKENRKGEVMHYFGSIEKIRKMLEFEPKVSIEEGIERSIKWYNSKGLT